jgi:iron(III) transport system substrate-binding protein
MFARITVLVLFIALLCAPFLFEPEREPPPSDARELIIITPHNEQIRTEFARAFDIWHQAHYGERVNVIYNVPGGTSEIRAMLIAQFEAAIKAGNEPGGNADLVFGGGTYEHDFKLKPGVTVKQDGASVDVSISVPVDFDDAWLSAVYGENMIGGVHLYDPDHHWFGTALSGFGIVYNRDALEQVGVDEPVYWSDLCDPKLRGWLALVNPAQSGSVTTALQAILDRRGWQQGWRILRRAAANGRYFSASSLKPPVDVSRGDAAMGICIDFYGRYEAQAVKEAGDPDRVGYVDPPGVSTIDPDPISMLRNAPHPELAKRFIEFCLTADAQSLWQFSAEDAGADGLGPHRFELRRMPVLRSMYAEHFDRMIDQVNPFDLATAVENQNTSIRSFIDIVFAGMAMDSHEHLKEAWNAIVEHPAYPETGGIVTAADVDDPTLKRMLELFDTMPGVEGPDGGMYSLAGTEHLRTVRYGWLKREWADANLWSAEANPKDVLRRSFAHFFRDQYTEIVDLAEGCGNIPPDA